MDAMERRRIVKLIGESSWRLSLIRGKAKPQHKIEKPIIMKKNRSLSLPVSLIVLFFILSQEINTNTRLIMLG